MYTFHVNVWKVALDFCKIFRREANRVWDVSDLITPFMCQMPILGHRAAAMPL